ncbi:integral membrane protein [Seiridium cupressi]
MPSTSGFCLSDDPADVRLGETRQELGWDDYLMGIGLIISIEPAICEFLLFPTDSFQKAAYAVIAYNLAWAVSTWVVNLTVCTPIAYYYDKTIQGGSCRNQVVSVFINAGLALLGDILVLALPMPMIYGLKVNRAKKTALAVLIADNPVLTNISVYSGCVASVIRIVELLKFTPTDASYTQVYASTWTTLEMGVAAVSGNLPTLGPLVKIIWRRLGTSHDASTKKSGAFTSSRSGPRLVYNEPAEVNASARHKFERLSDSESQLEPSSTNDFELQGSGIKVKKQITATRTSIGKP